MMAATKRALALIARGSEEMELVITVDVLRRCNVRCRNTCTPAD